MRTQLSRFLIHSLITIGLLVLLLAGLSRTKGFELVVGDVILRSQRGATIPLPPDVEPAPGPRALPPVPESDPESTPETVRNVILLIGDGMGIGHVSTASMALHGADGGLAFEAAPVTGLVRTACADRPSTDSAAAATAMATGFKTLRKAISWLPDGRAPRTLYEAAHDAGLACGLVTTSGLVDATPSAWIAHAERRDHYDSILEQMLASPIEVRIGGDWSGYRKALRNEEYWTILDDASSRVQAGTTIIRDPAALEQASAPLVGLFPPREPGSDAHGPALHRSARRAIELLSEDPDGFILMIECEITDEMGHDNDIRGVLAGMRELDEAVHTVLDMVADRDDTLVLITADHDTGSPSIGYDNDYSEGRVPVRWTGHDHTAQWVPLFAFGPGSRRFGRLMDNTELGLEIARLLSLEGFPDAG